MLNNVTFQNLISFNLKTIYKGYLNFILKYTFEWNSNLISIKTRPEPVLVNSIMLNVFQQCDKLKSHKEV